MCFGLKIFGDLNREKIKYMVWKNSNLIDDFLTGHENLDIFIHKSHHEKFEMLIKKNNWVEVKSTTNNFDKIKHYLYFKHNKILHIHAYFNLFTGNSISKNYDLSNYLDYFKNIHFDERYKMWILNYDLQLQLFIIRTLIKKKSFLGKYLLSRENDYYTKELNNIVYNIETKNLKFKKDNIKLLINDFYFEDKKKNKLLINSIKNFKRLNLFQSFFYELIFLARILNKKLMGLKQFKLNKEIVIFLSGPDSSGKTTFSLELKKLFNKFFKTKVYSIAKPYPKFLINYFIKKNYYKNKNSIISNYHSQKKNNLFIILKNINLSILRYFYSLKIFYFNSKTNIIILDRYLSENYGDINGPRINTDTQVSLLKKIMSKIEVFFYRSAKTLDHEYRILNTLETVLLRNQNRYKKVQKTDDEIISRYSNFYKSKFKSKKIFKINNNLSKENTLNNILYILSKNINENN